MNKHTSGPFRALPESMDGESHVAGRTPHVLSESGRAIASCDRAAGPREGRCEEAEANSVLFASAPVLLEACRWAVGTIRGNKYGLTEADNEEALRMVAEQCEGAIRRATGERHIFAPTFTDPDECKSCGHGIRHEIHLRVGEPVALEALTRPCGPGACTPDVND